MLCKGVVKIKWGSLLAGSLVFPCQDRWCHWTVLSVVCTSCLVCVYVVVHFYQKKIIYSYKLIITDCSSTLSFFFFCQLLVPCGLSSMFSENTRSTLLMCLVLDERVDVNKILTNLTPTTRLGYNSFRSSGRRL